jgi:hypothetical protein
MEKVEKRGGKRPGLGRKPTAIELDRERKRYQLPTQAKTFAHLDSPMQYLMNVMLDSQASWERRDDAARALLPYFHRKLADKTIGIKEAAQQEAESAGVDTEWEDDLTFNPSKAN